MDETTEVLDRETRRGKGNDSVEGIAYSKNKAVIMTGTFVEAYEVLSRYARSSKNKQNVRLSPIK